MSRRRVPLAIPVLLALLFSLTVATPVAAVESFLFAEMSGDQEVPGPGDPDGFAYADVRLDPDTGELCWYAFWEQIADPTAAHIHAGATGVAGAPVITLDLPTGDAEVCMDGLDPATLQAIADDPSSYYVNLHNAEFPDGAVRGQLRFPPVLLFASLSGENEVPGPGDPDAEGGAFLNFEADLGRLCAEFYVNNAEDFTAAHIHEGAAGVAGAPVITLPTPDADGYAFECLEGLDPALLQSILDDPAGYYLNVHTAEYPDGAARGQLTTEEPPPPPPGDCDPPEICNGVVHPGEYVYPHFPKQLSFTVDNQWQGRLFLDGFGLEDPDGLGALYVFGFVGLVGGEGCGWEDQVDIGTSPDDLVAWLTTHPSLNVSGVTDVTHAGLPGIQVDFTADVPDECLDSGVNLIFSPPIDSFYVLEGERVRFIIQVVGDETVLTIVDDYYGDNFQNLLADLETELDTMLWGEPAPPPEAGGEDLPDTAADASVTVPLWAAGLVLLGLAAIGGAMRLASATAGRWRP